MGGFPNWGTFEGCIGGIQGYVGLKFRAEGFSKLGVPF